MESKANLVIAATAGAYDVALTMPLDTAASRMQTSDFGKSKGFWTWDIIATHFQVPTLQSSTLVFDQLKQRLLKRKLKEGSVAADASPETLSAFTAFVLGAGAKCIATIFTYPAIRCKVMLEAAESDEN